MKRLITVYRVRADAREADARAYGSRCRRRAYADANARGCAHACERRRRGGARACGCARARAYAEARPYPSP